MSRHTAPDGKIRIRQSPLPLIGAVVAVILVVFYGWSQRSWLTNVADIESRDVDMQSRQLIRGFETELGDLHSVLGDYAISTPTADFVRGSRPDYFTGSLNAGGPADIALLGWVRNLVGYYEAAHLVDYHELANVHAWLERGLTRPAVQRGLKIPSKD